MEKLKVLSLFGGIGCFEMGLEKAGIPFEVVDYVDNDKYAVKSYNAIWGANYEPQDIIEWDKDIEVDLICHGSPCTNFSLAGKQAGGDKGAGTPSSLMWETVRIVGKLKPKYVFWENVKGLLTKKHRHNFDAYLETMETLGYRNYYQVMNAKNYGTPQNRERVFTVSVRKDIDGGFEFPDSIPLGKRLKDVLEKNVDERFYLYSTEGLAVSQTANGGGLGGPSGLYAEEPFIVASRGRNPNNPNDRTPGSPTKQRLEPRFDGTTNTITTVQKDNYVASPPRTRKLTPRECWRLQNIDDEKFEKAQEAGVSNTQLYRQAGNGIAVCCPTAIFSQLFGSIKWNTLSSKQREAMIG